MPIWTPQMRWFGGLGEREGACVPPGAVATSLGPPAPWSLQEKPCLAEILLELFKACGSAFSDGSSSQHITSGSVFLTPITITTTATTSATTTTTTTLFIYLLLRERG